MQDWRWPAVIGLGVVAAALLAVVAHDAWQLRQRAFPGFLVWDNGMLVAFHTTDWTGARAGLPLNGGRVVAVDGEPFTNGRALQAHVAARPVGTVFRYEVEHRGTRREMPVASMRLALDDWLLTFGNYLLNGTAFVAVALLALALRPDLAASRALAAATASVGLLMILALDYGTTYRFVRLCQMLEGAVPAAIAWFALVFPMERLSRERRRRVVPALFAVTLAVALANAALFYRDPVTARRLTDLLYLAMSAAGTAMLVSFAHALVRAERVRERVQAAVVFAGALGAFLLPAVSLPAFFLLGWNVSFTVFTALLFVFPISVLYAIVRYDLLGAERFIRLTVGYAVGTAAVVMGYAVAVAGVERFLSPEITVSRGTSLLLVLALALTFDPVRRRVQRGIDRVFYRSVVDPARVLEETGSELALCADEAAISDYVAHRVRDALGLEWAQLDASPGAPMPPPGEVAVEEPVQFRGERLGVVRCGPKRSGAPFSAAERDLVRGIAAQIALALRNVRSLQALREAQDTLLRTERLAVIGEFAGSVAHGIRNPLAAIRAGAQIAREQAREPTLAETLTGILEDTSRLDQRIRSLLDFSRPFEPRPRKTDVAALVGEVARVMERSAAPREIAVEITAEAVPPLETDPDLLEEALLELAGNALRVMDAGGRLRLSVAAEDGAVVIRVADTGPGIPEGVRGRVFDLFFTTRQEGTGVGLATVKKIVERLGGQVALERSGPEGTVFRVDLA